MRDARGRLVYLDSIRGLAALSVVANHYINAFGSPWSRGYGFPIGVLWDGQAAVSMFFVLSGFVLSYRHFGEIAADTLSYRRFAIARVCRIWIPYVVAVMAAATCYSLKVNASSPASLPWMLGQWNQRLTARTVAYDSNLLHIGQPFLLGQGWTLTIELVVSLLLPVAIIVAKRSSWWLIFSVALTAKCLHAPIFLIHFAAGVLLAKHRAAIQGKIPLAGLVMLLALALPLYDIRFVLHRPDWMDDRIWLVSGAGAFIILAVSLASNRIQRALSIGILAFLGRISYGVYLLHTIAIFCVAPRVFVLLQTWGIEAKWSIGFIVVIVVSVILSEAFHQLVELPAIRLGKLKFQRRPAPITVSASLP